MPANDNRTSKICFVTPSMLRYLQPVIPVLLAYFSVSIALAEDAPGFHIRTFAIKGARVVIAPGQSIDSANILVRSGKIAAVGADVEIPTEAEIIEGKGLTVYSGFIDGAAPALFDDSKAVPVEGRSVETSKYALAGMRSDDRNGLTPEFSAGKNLRTAPQDLEKYRQAGFVAVHVLPAGRIASGQGAVIQLATIPARESLLTPTTFTTFQLFERRGGEYPSTNMGIHAYLRQTFLDADRHAKQQRLFTDGVPGIERPANDSAYDAFNAIKAGRMRTIFICDSRDDHDRALNFAAEHQLRIAIWGGREAYRIADRLRNTETPVIVNVDFGDEPKVELGKPSEDEYPELPIPQSVREHKLKDWKERVAGLAQLQKAGIRFGVSSKDGKSPPDVLKGIRQAIANGLDRDTALAALTTQPAAILGLEKELGTIAVGRPAYFIALTGPFDNEQAKVKHVIIGGNRYEYNKDAKTVEPTKPGDPKPIEVAGKWSLEIESADGKIKAELELTQNDRSLAGRFVSEQGDGRISSGTAKHDGIEFVVSIGAGDAAIQLKFDTAGWTPPAPPQPQGETKPADATKTQQETARPTTLNGNLKSPFGATTKWTATRQDPKAQPNGPQQAAAVKLTGIETTEPTKAEATPSVSADAAKPTNAATASPSDSPANSITAERKAASAGNNAVPKAPPIPEQPVEFPEDRLVRHLVTGGNVLIKGATVLTATGLTLPKTSIMVKGGTIIAIGTDLQPEPGMSVIDATDRFVMPGIIDTHSHIMISSGLGGVNEFTSSIVCEVRIRDVVSSSDSSEYRALAGGVTTARLLHGSANCIGGQDAVVQLKHGTSAAEHLYPGAHSGVKFALGENVKARSGRFPNTRLGVEATLNRAFFEALDYRRTWLEYEQAKRQAGGAADRLLEPRRDLRLEALVDILNHQKFIHSHCYRSDEILMLLRVAENHGIRVQSLQHVLEGYKVAPEIVKHGASCSTFADWWGYKVEAFDATPHNAALLHEAGANTVIKSDDAELIRHLYLEAAKTVRYGNMPPDAALQAITLSPARELGLADRLGSIEVGKQADLAIFSGHPLNAFSRCEQTLIAGEVYFTREKQPTAMSTAGAAGSAKPSDLILPKPELRIARVDLDAAKGPKYAIVGATLHPVDTDDIPNGELIVEAGKIVAIGKTLPIPEGTPTVRVEGLHVYPGLIDAGTGVGLIEIAKVVETSDLGEIGQFQADLRAGVAVNPDSEMIPAARAGGITTTLCVPAGGGNMASHDRIRGAIIPGQVSLVQLAGWTMPEMVLNMEAGLHLLWPSGSSRKTNLEELKQHLKEARLYDKSKSKTADNKQVAETLVDPRYEALRPYLHGEKPIFVEVDNRQDIVDALHFADVEKLKIVLCGATDAWKVAERIKSAGVPVIIGPVMRRPVEDYDPFDAPYANAGRLYEAGVKFCFRSDTASNSRNVPFEAAMAVAYGLPEKEGLRAVTQNSSEILGLADRVGTLTVGKQANLIITDGSPLQETTQIKGIMIQGQPFQPESRQTKFYDKYRSRLKR